jgi:alpha-L-rhamnosidase
MMSFLWGIAGGDFRVAELRCEYRDNPLSVNTLNPQFSWAAISLGRGFLQSEYQIQVAADPASLEQGKKLLWDEKRKSDMSQHIRYAGRALESGRGYYWRVRIWDSAGNASPWSEVQYFSVGLLGRSDWSGAKWLALEELADSLRVVPGQEFNKIKIGDRKTALNRLPQFRREVVLKKNVKKAVVYTSGLGQFELFLNGRKVGDNFLDPAWSDYDKQVCYLTFDVTEELQTGANVFGMMLGNGLYNVPRERYFKALISYGYPKMIFKMDVEYADGKRETVVSDDKWRVTESPIPYSSIFGGEDYDATRECTGWMMPGYDDTKWGEPLVVTQRGELISPVAEPVRVMEEFPVVAIRKTRHGKWLYDMGQNYSGTVQLEVRGRRGQSVQMNTTELFNFECDSITECGGYRGEYRLTYTLRGDDMETWRPQFTYFGQRYVLISGAVPAGEENPEGLPEVVSLRGLHIRNATRMAGKFHCSNDLFNKTEQLISWGIKGNMVSYFTDCPHREKLPWIEQLHLMFGSLQSKFDVYTLYDKMLMDMELAQTEEGLIPDICPEYVTFLDGFRDSPEWGSAFVLAPWLVYEYYGDFRLVERHYEAMKRYVDYLSSKTDGYILAHGLGDWCDLGPKYPGRAQLTSLAGTVTPIYYMDALTICKAAEKMGRKEDAAKYGELARNIRTAYNAKYYHPETGSYDKNSQTGNALALYSGICEEQNRDAVLANLVKDIRDRGNALTAGDVGYNYVLRALEQSGNSQVIFDMNSRYDVYGYGYMLAQGATALPESWQALPRKSHNHLMLGHLLEWFYTYVGGIRRDDSALAYKKFIIRPEIVGDLRYAEASFHSPYGLIRSEWTTEEGGFDLLVEVPANTTARIYVPAGEASRICESGLEVSQCKDLEQLDTEVGYRVFGVGSGIYRFSVR